MEGEKPQGKGAIYNPNRLLDTLIEKMQLKNDAALCRRLEVAASLISKVRHGRSPVGAPLLIRMHEISGLDISELRALMGDRRRYQRVARAPGKGVNDRASELDKAA